MKKIIDENAAFISAMCCLLCMCAFALGFAMGKNKCESYIRKEYSEVLLDYDRALNQAGYYYENEVLDVQMEHDDWEDSEEQKSWNVYCDARENIELFKQNHK